MVTFCARDEIELSQPQQPTVSPEVTFDYSASGSSNSASVVEMLLKDRTGLDRRLRAEHQQRQLVPQLMAIAVVGFLIYGVVVTALLNAFHEQSGVWLAHIPPSNWNDLSVANLTLSFTLGLIAANGICLPSFYFYGLLAGIETTMVGVTVHALKGMAAGALALVGLLPIYIAASLTALVFPQQIGGAMFWSAFGLLLPFIAGLWGAFNLYQGFVALADTMPPARRSRRECFLRRLIFAWCGCYTFVTPLVIYSLWSWLGHITQFAV